ncbi:MAG: BTAD domain-containing putative transcriptional regulator, partial [Gemmatimonadota bacterium]|nr:BTAD domain-containing putative transcriptional regulator [Gemmatimonadota bacterium]
MGKIEFRTLGSPDLLRSDGTAVRSVLAQPKRVALLSYIAVCGNGGFLRRDALCGAFWPEAEQSQARHRLRTALHMLRKALGHDVLIGRGDEEIGLSRAEVWCDVEAFERAVEEGRHGDALDLYRGDFLGGFHVRASHDFEEWLRGTRERLQRLAASSAKALSAAAVEAGDHEVAIRWAARAREIAPLDESALRLQLDSLDAAGRRAEALGEYDVWVRRLKEELGVEP